MEMIFSKSCVSNCLQVSVTLHYFCYCYFTKIHLFSAIIKSNCGKLTIGLLPQVVAVYTPLWYDLNPSIT